MQNELNQYLEAIKADYRNFQLGAVRINGTISEKVALQQIDQFNNGLRFTDGKQYIKVISGTGVHSFIVKEDGVKFKKGDILKAASWNAPAKNSARGNILGQYRTYWTGAGYLR